MFSTNVESSIVVNLEEHKRAKEAARQEQLLRQMRSIGWHQVPGCIYNPLNNEVGMPTVFSLSLRQNSYKLYVQSKVTCTDIPIEEPLQPDLTFDWIDAYK